MTIVSPSASRYRRKAERVDVIFARHLAAGKGEKAGEGVAEDGPAPVADMHRPGGVGRDIFDIDLALQRPRPALFDAAKVLGVAERGAQNLCVNLRLQPDVDEARPGDLRRRDALRFRQGEADFGGEFARAGEMALRFLRENHRRIAGEIAERRVLRRLDHETGRVERRQTAGGRYAVQDRGDACVEDVENVHGDRCAVGMELRGV